MELTIKVVVITLAIPSPCGTISSQRCHVEVLSFQLASIDAATTVIAHDTSVSVYSLPVRRITLRKYGHFLIKSTMANNLPSREYGACGDSHLPESRQSDSAVGRSPDTYRVRKKVHACRENQLVA